MSGSLEIVYQYRQLLAKCESSEGLTLDEIERFSALEDHFAAGHSRVEFDAHLRGRKYIDPITVAAIGPNQASCSGCPYLEEGQTVELRIKSGEDSYRFAARVIAAHECEDDTFDATLEFEGAPVLVRHTREFPAIDLATFAA